MNPPPSSATLRLATPADIERVLEIYTPYVNDTAITFETEVPELDAFATRMALAAQTYPFIVAESVCDAKSRGEAAADTTVCDTKSNGETAANTTVIGYAYAHPCGEKAAYGWNAELTVYLVQQCRSQGCGRMLCEALLALLALQGIRNVFSLITVPNEPSFRLHENLGFEHIGIQKHAGYKCEAWHDVAWLQKSLGDFSGAPAAPLPAEKLDASLVLSVFKRIENAAKTRWL